MTVTAYVEPNVQTATDAAKPPEPKPLKELDVQSRITAMLQDARTFDEEQKKRRHTATEYFLGKKFGNEEQGRSQVVMTEVRDTVFSMYPAMMRLFFNSAERTVEFVPKTPDMVELADQQTEYINHVFLRENNGLLLTNAVLEDGLVRRLGVVKWWWEASPRTETADYSGLTRDELETLAADPDIELSGLQPDPASSPAEATFSCQVKRTLQDGRIRIEAIPREEFWYNRRARNREDAVLMAHATFISVSEARRMGYDEARIQDAYSQEDPDTIERAKRDPDDLGSGTDAAATDENALLRYVEAYVNLDVDGDGIAELRRICTLGPGFKVCANEPCDERPFAYLTPYPLAHRLEGLDVADLTMDIQLLESNVARGILDSLSLSLFPRMAVVEGQVEMKDVLNTEIGALIRTKAPGMVQEVTHRFVGGDAMPVLDWIESKRENRTGRARGPDGLDQGAMQSSTPQAVDAAVSASRDRLELLARVAAETFFKPLFIGLYKLAKKHQKVPKTLKYKNSWVQMDPLSWDDEPDVMVNVALGSGLIEQKLEVLTGMKQSIEAYIQQYGPNNPLCGFAELRAVIDRASRLAGEHHVDKFFKPIDPNNPPQMPPQQPDPAAQAAAAQVQLEQQKLELQQRKQMMDAQLASAKLQQDQQAQAVKTAIEQEKLRILNERTERTLAARERMIELTHQRESARIELDAQLRREEILAKYSAEAGKREALRETSALEAGIEAHARVLDAAQTHETAMSKAELDAQTKIEVAHVQADAKPAKEAE